MKILKLIFFFVILNFAFNLQLFAIRATPFPITVSQPDGTKLTIHLHGDEFYSYQTTSDGYLLTTNEENFFVYSYLDDVGNPVSTTIKAHNPNERIPQEIRFLENILPNPDLSTFLSNARKRKAAKDLSQKQSSQSFSPEGTIRSLVLLVNFSDVSFVTPNPKDSFHDLLNQEGYSANGGTGSARDYFKASSTGAFNPEFVVVGPYTLPQPREFYGGNVGDDKDINVREMVKDACRLASEDGVDFSEFDTNNDGYVDNVFIYYAGHNEAEGGPRESVWPHRWVTGDLNTQYNGKVVYDYACTSELRANTGTNMCGIGTFVHEFGHVLGLPDYYATNGARHHTLSYWDVMDSGSYLNLGRTPPLHSAYSRFFLGWLKPTLLNEPQELVELHNLSTTNSAYLLTLDGSHNLNGSNPSPREFIMLENRQNSGWDRYLPGHGMLVTRICYDMYKWYTNTVNNDPYAMGYDILEADGQGSTNNFPGDPFPGTSGVTTFIPKTVEGINMYKELTEITEIDGVISFKFMGGIDPEIHADADIKPYHIVYGSPSGEQALTIIGKKLKSDIFISFSQSQNFEICRPSVRPRWAKELKMNAGTEIAIEMDFLIRYNPVEPSYSKTHKDYLLIESDGCETIRIELEGQSTRPIYVTPPLATAATEITDRSFVANWQSVEDATGYYLSVMAFTEGSTTLTEGFKGGLTPPDGWQMKVSDINTSSRYYGESSPSLLLSESDDYIETEYYHMPVLDFTFFAVSVGSSGKLIIEGMNNDGWTLIESIQLTTLHKRTHRYAFEPELNYSKFRIKYESTGTGSVSIDDLSVRYDKQTEQVITDKWLTETSFSVLEMSPDIDYLYRVKASDKALFEDGTLKYENITNFSNPIFVQLIPSSIHENFAEEYTLFEAWENRGMKYTAVYTISGQLLKVINPEAGIDAIMNLPGYGIYIVQIGDRRFKLLR